MMGRVLVLPQRGDVTEFIDSPRETWGEGMGGGEGKGNWDYYVKIKIKQNFKKEMECGKEETCRENGKT